VSIIFIMKNSFPELENYNSLVIGIKQLFNENSPHSLVKQTGFLDINERALSKRRNRFSLSKDIVDMDFSRKVYSLIFDVAQSLPVLQSAIDGNGDGPCVRYTRGFFPRDGCIGGCEGEDLKACKACLLEEEMYPFTTSKEEMSRFIYLINYAKMNSSGSGFDLKLLGLVFHELQHIRRRVSLIFEKENLPTYFEYLDEYIANKYEKSLADFSEKYHKFYTIVDAVISNPDKYITDKGKVKVSVFSSDKEAVSELLLSRKETTAEVSKQKRKLGMEAKRFEKKFVDGRITAEERARHNLKFSIYLSQLYPSLCESILIFLNSRKQDGAFATFEDVLSASASASASA
jgi:hypothetical protein